MTDERRRRAQPARRGKDEDPEVRAGPGDAGGEYTPEDAGPRRAGRGVFIALLAGGPLLMLLFWLAAG